MRLELFASGLIDDLVCDASVVGVRRAGESRYVLSVTGSQPLRIEFWTTRKDRVVATAWDAQPAWAEVVLGPLGELESFSASECLVHLEHLDRNLYMLGVSRDAEAWGIQLRAHGYLKTRVVEAQAP